MPSMPESISVWVRLHTDQLSDKDIVPSAADRLYTVNLEASHRQPIGQLSNRQGKFYVVTEPFCGSFHLGHLV